MVVPRSFLFSSTTSETTTSRSAKGAQPTDIAFSALGFRNISNFSLPDGVDARLTHAHVMDATPKPDQQTAVERQRSAHNRKQALVDSQTLPRRLPSARSGRPLPSSIASVLEATAIPVPRRTWSGGRRLRRSDSTWHYSKSTVDEINLRDGQRTGRSGNAALKALLSPPVRDDKLAVGSEYYSVTPSASIRSSSTESIPSLEHDVDSQSGASLSSQSSCQRSYPERRGQWLSNSENCAFDHPLLEVDVLEVPLDFAPFSPKGLVGSERSSVAAQSLPRLGSAFKSNLTASLRALRSAAQTVSALATPPVQQDDFLTRPLFAISPKLTDDRRPPPMNEPPSPALRRYLNPIAVSPAEMQVYREYPPECSEIDGKCPASVQMQTYRVPGARDRGKGGFHFSVIDDLPYDHETTPTTRQREPRENGDFLRVAVLEMNMKRSGKLRDDIPTRARIWLPPRKSSSSRSVAFGQCGYNNAVTPRRWAGICAELA